MTTKNKLAEIATFVDIGIANAYIAMNSGFRANILVEYNQQAPKICAALDRHSAFLSLIDDGYQCVDQFFLDFRAELRSMGSAVELLIVWVALTSVLCAGLFALGRRFGARNVCHSGKVSYGSTWDGRC